jgi:hypothetical protein
VHSLLHFFNRVFVFEFPMSMRALKKNNVQWTAESGRQAMLNEQLWCRVDRAIAIAAAGCGTAG